MSRELNHQMTELAKELFRLADIFNDTEIDVITIDRSDPDLWKFKYKSKEDNNGKG